MGRGQECLLLGGGARVEGAGAGTQEGDAGGLSKWVWQALCWASWQANPLSSTPLYLTEGFRGWEVEHGGNGWAVEKNLILVPGAPSQTCFVTSFE